MPYKTKKQALAIGESIGCKGVHKMPDGSYMPCSTREEYERLSKKEINKSIEISKVDEDKRLVYAWAYVYKKDGKEIIDHSGDIIEEEEVEKMAFDFMTNSREGGEMHIIKKGIADVVSSMVFTEELQKALDINVPNGWLVVLKVKDDDVWSKIKKGEYKMMSIGGKGIREKIS